MQIVFPHTSILIPLSEKAEQITWAKKSLPGWIILSDFAEVDSFCKGYGDKLHSHAVCVFDMWFVLLAHPGDSAPVSQPGDRDGLW